MSKTTPGPWKWDDHDADDSPRMDGYLRGPDDKPIVYGEDAGPDWPRTPDARLIAAAPELLEALRDMLAAEMEWDGQFLGFFCNECGRHAKAEAEIEHGETCGLGQYAALIKRIEEG